jgi:hypothetical protein
MAFPQFVRDPNTPEPSDLDEEEQKATMVKAVKQRGGVHRGEELTALPLGTPPPGGAWRAAGNINAPGSGKPYKIYMKFPPKHGPGITGSRTKHPVSDAGTMPVTTNKPSSPAGSSPGDVLAAKNPIAEHWLGAVESDQLTAYSEELQKVLDNPAATEDQISDKVKAALAESRRISLLGGGEDSMVSTVMKQVVQAADQVGDMRNSALEGIIQQEERAPGSISDDKFKEKITSVLGAERQRQLLGSGGSSKVLELVGEAVGVVADRKADAVQDLLDQDKRAPGSVTETRFSGAIRDLLGMVREAQLLGISRPKTDSALASVGEVMKVVVERKADARSQLIQQKDAPGSGVTDQHIQQATDDLNQIKEQARRLGISVP